MEETDEILRVKMEELKLLDEEMANIRYMQKDINSEMDKICLDPTYEKWAYLTKDDIMKSAMLQHNLKDIDEKSQSTDGLQDLKMTTVVVRAPPGTTVERQNVYDDENH